MAARKKGLDVTKAEVKDLIDKNESKQLISAAQPSKGKIAAGTKGSRWQADLAEFQPRDSGLKQLRYVLTVVNVFDRKVYTRMMKENTTTGSESDEEHSGFRAGEAVYDFYRRRRQTTIIS